MSTTGNEQDYLFELEERGRMPRGFRASATALPFTPQERPSQEPYRMRLASILLDKASESFAGVFTKNAFPGAPVLIGRERLKRKKVQGIVVNNKIANVSTKTGVSDAEELCETLARELSLEAQAIFPVSTGIIGWKLPITEMKDAVPSLVSSLQRDNLLPVAKSMMTTDSFPKIRRVENERGAIVGLVKGAGMVEPNMGTMLAFLLSEFSFDRREAQEILRRVVEKSFNSISVDGDQSTSDMCLLLGSGEGGHISGRELEQMLLDLCLPLAEDIVRNGEGTSHVIEVKVSGRRNAKEARDIAKAVVNSPLVKTAIYGNDPNVGRILAALGDYIGNAGLKADRNKLEISIGGQLVFFEGVFQLDREKEQRISEYLQESAMNTRVKGYPQHDRKVEIRVHFHDGSEEARVLGTDLSHEYVTENADYRT